MRKALSKIGGLVAQTIKGTPLSKSGGLGSEYLSKLKGECQLDEQETPQDLFKKVWQFLTDLHIIEEKLEMLDAALVFATKEKIWRTVIEMPKDEHMYALLEVWIPETIEGHLAKISFFYHQQEYVNARVFILNLIRFVWEVKLPEAREALNKVKNQSTEENAKKEPQDSKDALESELDKLLVTLKSASVLLVKIIDTYPESRKPYVERLRDDGIFGLLSSNMYPEMTSSEAHQLKSHIENAIAVHEYGKHKIQKIFPLIIQDKIVREGDALNIIVDEVLERLEDNVEVQNDILLELVKKFYNSGQPRPVWLLDELMRREFRTLMYNIPITQTDMECLVGNVVKIDDCLAKMTLRTDLPFEFMRLFMKKYMLSVHQTGLVWKEVQIESGKEYKTTVPKRKDGVCFWPICAESHTQVYVQAGGNNSKWNAKSDEMLLVLCDKGDVVLTIGSKKLGSCEDKFWAPHFWKWEYQNK